MLSLHGHVRQSVCVFCVLFSRLLLMLFYLASFLSLYFKYRSIFFLAFRRGGTHSLAHTLVVVPRFYWSHGLFRCEGATACKRQGGMERVCLGGTFLDWSLRCTLFFTPHGMLITFRNISREGKGRGSIVDGVGSVFESLEFVGTDSTIF